MKDKTYKNVLQREKQIVLHRERQNVLHSKRQNVSLTLTSLIQEIVKVYNYKVDHLYQIKNNNKQTNESVRV